MYNHLLVSIWLQSQITEINLCLKAVSWKHLINKSWGPSKCQIFCLNTKVNSWYQRIPSHTLDTNGYQKGPKTLLLPKMSFLVPATFWDFAFSPKNPRFWNFEVRKDFEIFCRHTVNGVFMN